MVLLPGQKVVDPEILTVGLRTTVREMSAVFVQPLASVMVTAYMPDSLILLVVNEGSAFVLLKPLGPDHDHMVAVPPSSIKSKSSPKQTVVLGELILIAGAGFSVTLNDEDAVHPLTSVTVTSYSP